jgi:C4-dicarboxylate transporter DctM subunit
VSRTKIEMLARTAMPMLGLMLLVLLVVTYIPEVPLIFVGK